MLSVPFAMLVDTETSELLIVFDIALALKLFTLSPVEVIMDELLLFKDTIFDTDELDTFVIADTVLALLIDVFVFMLVDTEELGTLVLVIDNEILLFLYIATLTIRHVYDQTQFTRIHHITSFRVSL